ncbi:hypothetical protein BGZ47_005184 [Haplosporangium gracile]|nr:hypothetical protein BGZ47_005184 [Haplosporangium gracile]
MNLRAMMKERALNDDREAMKYVEHSHELARRGCWPVDLDQDFDMDASIYHHHRLTFDGRDSGREYCANTDVATAFGMHEMNDLPMDIDGCEMDEWMQCESAAPIVITTKALPSSSPSSCLPIASAVSPQQQPLHKNTSSLSSSKDPQLPTVSSSSSTASCSSHSPSFANWTVPPEREKDGENESVLEATPLGISIPLIEANTNGSSGNERWQVNEYGSSRSGNGGSDGDSPSWRMGVPSALSSLSLFSQGVSFRHPREGQIHQQQQSQSPFSRNTAVPANPLNTSTTTPLSTSTTTTTATSTPSTIGTQQKMQQILNRNDKIAFLTKYTDRMHLKLQALGIEDWGQGDIQRKKTYQLMIQHNDKTGEKDLVKFYLGRYGGSVTTASGGDAGAGAGMQGVQEPVGPLGLPLPLSAQQGQQQGQEQQGTPVVVQA